MDRRQFLAITAGATLAGACRAHGDSPLRTGVDPVRLARLARGVNLASWMWIPHARGEAARRAFITEADLRELAATGMTHVRLPFEPAWLWDAGALKPAELAEYTDATKRCLDAGLAVVVDAHWNRTGWIHPRGASYDERFGELERMWRALAANLAPIDPAQIFLELLNEPHDLESPDHWHDAQRRITSVVRDAAPDHTLIATGAQWGGIDGLLRVPPLEDRNTVYSFHFYEPHDFTHQGAEWGFAPWKDMKDVPWPAEPEQLEKLADALPDASRNALRWAARTGDDNPWNPDQLRQRLDQPAAWAREHDVPLYCGEFGAYTRCTPRDCRLAWHREVADALRERGIGWGLWDYVGGFHIAEGEPGARTLDAQLCEALGLEAAGTRPIPP